MSDARTVIAGWLTKAEWENNFENSRGMSTNDHADAILAALAEAGFVVVPRKNLRALSRRVANGRSLPDFFLISGKNGGDSE